MPMRTHPFFVTSARLFTRSMRPIRCSRRAGFQGRSWWMTSAHSRCRSIPSEPIAVHTRISGARGELKAAQMVTRVSGSTDPVNVATTRSSSSSPVFRLTPRQRLRRCVLVRSRGLIVPLARASACRKRTIRLHALSAAPEERRPS